MSALCDCRFNGVCAEYRQVTQRGWVKQGMKPEDVFGPPCPWYEGELENLHYLPGDGVPPEEKVA